MAIGPGKDFRHVAGEITVEGTVTAEVIGTLTAPYYQFRDPITGLHRLPIPEPAEDELARLREEVARLREALVDERAKSCWQYHRDTGIVSWAWVNGTDEQRAPYRRWASDQLRREGLLPPD